MTFHETQLRGVLIIEAEVYRDERGSFMPAWLPDRFKARGLDTSVAQASLATNLRRGTIRGLHYQIAPMEVTGRGGRGTGSWRRGGGRDRRSRLCRSGGSWQGSGFSGSS